MAEVVVRLFSEASADVFDPGTEETPRNVLAEKCIVGTLLRRNKSLDYVIDVLTPDMFFDRLLGNIFDEVRKRIVAGESVDVVTLAEWVSWDRTFGSNQGKATQFLADVLKAGVSVDIRGYAEQIASCAVRRQIMDACREAKELARNPRADAKLALTKLAASLDGAAAGRRRTVTFDEAIKSGLAHAREAHERGNAGGLPLPGFPRVDNALVLMPREFTALAGIPGSGKSGLGWQWAIAIARYIRDQNLVRTLGCVMGLSLEMSKEMLAIRAMSASSGVCATKILRGETSAEELRRVEIAAEELEGLPLVLNDINGLNIRDIELLFHREQIHWGAIALGVIDHLNLVAQGDYGDRHGRVQGTAAIADGALRLGKRFNCHILGLCQLSEKDIRQRPRRDRRATRGDIKWSGSITENADNIALIHRQIQFEGDSPPDMDPGEDWQAHKMRVAEWEHRQQDLKCQADLIIDKVRMGAGGFAIRLMFDGKTTSFSEDPTFPMAI